MKIVRQPSPNFNDRKEALDLLVLHYTGMETGDAAIDRLCDPEASVSAHYVVRETGEIVQLVAEGKRAWHAGVSTWMGQIDLNSRSIGIEIVNGGHNVPLEDGSLPPYSDAQIEAVIWLSKDITRRHAIRNTRIVGHSDIAPGRKIDPGEHFPWERLAQDGLGLWPEKREIELDGGVHLLGHGLVPGAQGEAVSRVKGLLVEIGYSVEAGDVYDQTCVDCIDAFQRRWVQDRVSGAADLVTLRTLERVADMYQRTRQKT